jgi:alpha-D-xyloside xylohydrolase
MFWSQIDRELFKKGVDAWWMDASEPDLMSVPNLEGHRARMVPTGLGKPSNGINLYALATAQAVYEGQRRAAPDQRVFNLTRSGYAGQQRYGATTWSGDITSTWTALARQIPAGLGFSISGNPYWTMDTGGFSVPSRFAARNAKPEDVDEWRELNTRWFEFATFVPLLRLHGEFPYREIWQFGGEGSPAYRAMVDFDRLRYRLMPYLYSVAGAVTQDGATMMRPLAMDFPDDPTVRSLPDEYMFGPTFLVSPVVHYRQRVRPVVLPKGLWYDFWTGRVIEGGRTVEAAAPYNRIPLYVRAGSIVPFGPEIQYATEKPADPITLLVYTGADGQFSLYEDDGLTNAYERGEFARIPLTWSERTHTLTIGGRAGSFKGMLSSRTFRVAFVSPGNPVPFSFDLPAARTVVYSGAPVQVRL